MGLPPEVATAPPDARFGRFVRVALLGAGGMGEVWKAWDTALSRWVALKFTKGIDAHDLERFQREAVLAAGLSHPNIASIYEVGDSGGRPWIAMQFIEGRTLRGLRASAKEAAGWIRDVARAVQVAHDQKVVHRDLKPDNVMLDGHGRVYVMDFGLARPVDAGPGLTRSGTAVGTPSYMPPEQALGSPSSARSDVYGIGATLYDLLAGRAPFAGDNILDVLNAVCQDDPARIRGVEADLETIALKCLEKDPSRRYGSAAEVADDLDRWLNGEPIRARPPSAGYRLRKFLQRRLAAVIAAAVAIAAAGIVAGWALKVAADERRADDERRTREHRASEAATLLERARTAISRAERLRARESPRADIVKAVADARPHIDAAASLDAPAAAVHHLRGLCAELEGDDDAAETAWRKAVEADARFAPAQYRLGMLLVTRAMTEAIGMSQAESSKRSASMRTLAGEATRHLEAAGDGLEEDLLRDVAKAANLWCQGKPDQAAGMLTEALKQRSGLEALADANTLLSQMQPRGDARNAALAAALRDSPGHPLARFYRGVERTVAGDFKGAITDYALTIECRPRFVWAYLNRGLARRRSDDAKGAIDDYRRALELEPGNPVIVGALALSQRDAGDFDAALKTIEAGLALHPDSADLYHTRGSIKQKQSDRAGARADYDRAIDLNPDFVEALANRGVVRMADGDNGGLADFDRAIGIEPKHPFSRHWRGVARKRQGDFDGAIEDLAVAVEVWPDNASSWFHYAHALASKGRNEEALPAYERCLALDPRMADAYASRAVARRNLGDRDGALKDAEKALEVGGPQWPNRKMAERLRDQLRN